MTPVLERRLLLLGDVGDVVAAEGPGKETDGCTRDMPVVLVT
jgi:hypothetical protein